MIIFQKNSEVDILNDNYLSKDLSVLNGKYVIKFEK